MEKEELNMLYLLKRVINKAHQNSDVITLTLLLNKIIENNEDIKIALNLKTIDAIIYKRLIDEMDSAFNEAGFSIGNKFCDVSEGVIKLIELDSARIKAKK